MERSSRTSRSSAPCTDCLRPGTPSPSFPCCQPRPQAAMDARALSVAVEARVRKTDLPLHQLRLRRPSRCPPWMPEGARPPWNLKLPPLPDPATCRLDPAGSSRRRPIYDAPELAKAMAGCAFSRSPPVLSKPPPSERPPPKAVPDELLRRALAVPSIASGEEPPRLVLFVCKDARHLCLVLVLTASSTASCRPPVSSASAQICRRFFMHGPGLVRSVFLVHRELARTSRTIGPRLLDRDPTQTSTAPAQCRNSTKSVRCVRIRSTTLDRLLHGFVLLPSGISGKINISLDTTTIIAMIVVSFYRYVTLPTTRLTSLPKCHDKPLTLHIPTNPCLSMLPLAQPFL